MPCILNVIGRDPSDVLVDKSPNPAADERATVLGTCPRCVISSKAVVSAGASGYTVAFVSDPRDWPQKPSEWYILRFTSRDVATAWLIDYGGELSKKEVTALDSDAAGQAS